MDELTSPTEEHSERALSELAARFSIEATPRTILSKPAHLAGLPKGTQVYVPFLPGARFEEAIRACRALSASGFVPVPHLAARAVPSRAALEEWVGGLAAEGVEAVLLIAGDLDAPNGPYPDVAIADRLYDLGRHGQKTKKGWYDYGEDGRTPVPSPEVETLILEASREKGITRQSFSADEIRKRALAALVNEGARILEEGIAARPVDIDMVWLHGYGFPAHEGGPMFWADAYGLDRLLADIERFAEDDPKSWKPAPLLERLAREGGSFKAWSEARGRSQAA